MSDDPVGTYECRICGFDKPHTHDAVELRGPLNENQRRYSRQQAEHQYRTAELKGEFDADPNAYIDKYGTINSYEGFLVVGWLRERLNELARENISTAAESRLLRAQLAEANARAERYAETLLRIADHGVHREHIPAVKWASDEARAALASGGKP